VSKEIIWSPLAESDFANILEYLHHHWNGKVVNEFIDLTENTLTQISINPKQFPLIHKRKRIRKCVLTRHNTIFYRAGKAQVDILRIYDTRQDPDSLIFS